MKRKFRRRLRSPDDLQRERRIGVPDPQAAVREALAEVRELPPELRPLHACKRLTETALAAHRSNRAGDNVACALLWLAD